MPVQLTEREKHILRFFYDNQDCCCIDDGNVLAHYSKRYDDWKNTDDKRYDESLQRLIETGLIERDEPPMDCFISITDKGLQTYKVT